MNHLPIEVRTNLEFKSYRKLVLELTYQKRTFLILGILGVFSYLVLIWYWLDLPGSTKSEGNFPFLMVGFALAATFIPFAISRGAKKNFESNSQLRETIIYTFREEEFELNGESFSSKMSWNKMYQVVEKKDWFLIYHDKVVANFIPKNSFSEPEITAFRALINSKPDLKKKLLKS